MTTAAATREPETAFLVGVEVRSETDSWALEASLAELASLADTAGLEVIGSAAQRLNSPVPATFLGKGKVEEVHAAALELGADAVLIDHELSPRQQRNLEGALESKVLDRTALILDIFAQHARTKEGMLQVELAHIRVPACRASPPHVHRTSPRQAGGRAGGARGAWACAVPARRSSRSTAGEIQRRIRPLKEELEDGSPAAPARVGDRRKRAGLPVVALVGYTNAGKSTLMNAAVGARIYTANQLFATLDPTTRRLDLPSRRTCLDDGHRRLRPAPPQRARRRVPRHPQEVRRRTSCPRGRRHPARRGPQPSRSSGCSSSSASPMDRSSSPRTGSNG